MFALKSLNQIGIISLFLAIFVSGCGLEPLYGPHTSLTAPNIEEHLTSIKIEKIQDREGQILRNHLLDKLTPSGEPASPKAHLKVDLVLNKNAISLRRDGTTQRFNITATANITLRDTDQKKILYTDTIKRTASFSVGDATAAYGYASTVSEKDAKRRTILLVAQDLHIMLATYYKKWSP